MANQTVTTVVNYDDPSINGLLNGEALTINGGSVTINADVRWNQQAAVFGNITISSTLGGSFIIDGTDVWELYFDASTGNVPAQDVFGGANGVNGANGATGELLRVWATGSLTPATAGEAMPATGWIKLRSKTGNFADNEVVTLPGGATITLTGAGKRSWIHAVGRGTTTGGGSRLIVPRLATFEVVGDWYELGETDGTDSQTFQYPVADMCPALWIETAPSSGVYEIWLNAGNRWLDGAISTDDRRGTYFGCDDSTGVITIAERGANNAGYKPPSGCRVRIPNVILSQANGTTGTWDVNFLPASALSRYGLDTRTAGPVNISHSSVNWFLEAQSAITLDIRHTGAGSTISVTNTGLSSTFEDVGIGIVDTAIVTPLNISGCTGGGSLTDVRIARRLGVGGGSSLALSLSIGFDLLRVRSDSFGASGTNAVGGLPFSIVGASDITMTDCVSVGGTTGVSVSRSSRIDINNQQHAGRSIGTAAVEGNASIGFVDNSSDCEVNGLSSFENLPNIHPYAYLVSMTTGATNITVSNIGSPSAPYDLGTINSTGYVALVSGAQNVTLRRVYVENLRLSPVLTSNTSSGMLLENVWGDEADDQRTSSNDSLMRGCRYTPSTIAQSAVYGTHWTDAWDSTTSGRIVIHCNEPTPTSVSQCAATLDRDNGSGFTSAGSVSMTQLSDVIIWTMPYYAIGITGFANVAPTITGTNAGNHTLEFQYDLNDGAEFNGSWLALDGTNLSAITVNPANGIKLKIRATVNTAAQTNLLTYIRIDTTTTSSDRQIQYPLKIGAELTVTSLVPGSRIKVVRTDTGVVLENVLEAGTSRTFSLTYTGDVRVEARNSSGTPAYKPWFTIINVGTGVTVTALQEID